MEVLWFWLRIETKNDATTHISLYFFMSILWGIKSGNFTILFRNQFLLLSNSFYVRIYCAMIKMTCMITRIIDILFLGLKSNKLICQDIQCPLRSYIKCWKTFIMYTGTKIFSEILWYHNIWCTYMYTYKKKSITDPNVLIRFFRTTNLKYTTIYSSNEQ